MEREKLHKYLSNYRELLSDPNDTQLLFLLAICHVQLGEYAEAHRLFEETFLRMFNPRKFWNDTNQANWLVDICFLSNRLVMLPDVHRELELFKLKFNKGYPLVAHYAFSLVELYLPSGWDITASIKELLKRPKIKDMYAIGEALKAIIDNNPNALQDAIHALLKAHRGIAKYGELRETAEGLLCMSAMTLGRTASDRGLSIQIDNEYYSNGYLQYLLGIRDGQK